MQDANASRLGLVHEGQAKNAWRRWRGQASHPLVDFERKAICRDVMQQQIEDHLDRCAEVAASVELQGAFIQKCDYLYQNTAQIGTTRIPEAPKPH